MESSLSILYILQSIVLSFYPIILFFGLIGNFTTFLIFSRKKFKLLKTTIYFKFLNITESITLSISVIDYLNFQFGISLLNVSRPFCKLTYYVLYMFSPVSGWILVILSLDRLLSTKYPSKLLIRNKKQIKLLICGCVVLFNMIYYMPMAIFSDFKQVDLNDSLNNISNHKVFINECITGDSLGICDWMDLLNSSIIPFVFMTLFTIKALQTLFESRRKTRIVSTSTTQGFQSIRKRDIRYAFTLLIFNFCFITLNLPVVAFYLIVRYVEINESLAKFFNLFTSLLFYSYFGLFFYLNLMINSVFRNELKTILKLIRKKFNFYSLKT
jgi:hypothetical protein